MNEHRRLVTVHVILFLLLTAAGCAQSPATPYYPYYTVKPLNPARIKTAGPGGIVTENGKTITVNLGADKTVSMTIKTAGVTSATGTDGEAWATQADSNGVAVGYTISNGDLTIHEVKYNGQEVKKR